ncbi:hypothetical protein CHLRE_07g331114v5 [Chlamydomonas reinhardtii]|uniref:Uncharacterized protein n=1 Tax=Chlamydomonas reinhardtii TaxID=3055 RepID=A0A2K3DJV2_CHLRE|nr:uncharacterized protein CHLRE_07g331114v5 [Chlamydomonas reinhardtii]PNW80824.1 hypothetical protein CHLRE_07g331114v5 [Chlamydomonas reinhardtii]
MQLQRSLLVALAGFGARASQCARVAARRTNAAHVDAQQATWMLSDVPRRQASVVAAAAAAGGDDLDKFLNAIPPESHGLAIKFISGLQQQVADKSAELAAKSDEAERLAMELEATKKKLQTTQRTLLLSFSVAGVVDARSFLEHVVKIWEAEGTPGAPGKPQDILKEGLSKLPDLGKCLRREVPSWVCADMNDEQAGVYVRLLGPPLLTLR